MERPKGPQRGSYFAAQLDQIVQQDLLDVQRHLLELVEHPGWKFVQGLVQARAEAEHKALLSTDAKDHYSFIQRTAEERVLRALLDAPNDALGTARWVDQRRAELLERQQARAGHGGGTQ